MKSKYHVIFNQKFILFFVIFFSLCNGFPTKTVTENICRTSECNQTASRVLDFMDATINPCEDFYKFACGNFMKNTLLPNDKGRVNFFTDMEDQVREQLKTFVKVEISPNMFKLSKRVKTFYDICMNKTAINRNGLNSLKDKFKKLGGWPVVEGSKWNESAFNLTNSIYMLRKLGYNFWYFFTLDVGVDQPNMTEKFTIMPPKLPILAFPNLNRSNLLEDKKVKSYKTAMIESAVLLGADREIAEIELKKSLEFEVELVNNMVPNNNHSKFNGSQSMTVAELNRYYPNISWVEFLNMIYHPYVNVKENTKVINVSTFYLQNLKNLMDKTSKRTLANYILWRVFLESSEFLSDEYQRPITDFEATAFNIQKPNTTRSEKCFEEVVEYWNHNIGILYVRNYSKEADKKSIIEMVENIKSELKKTLQTADWIDEETKKYSIHKVNAMRNHIAYEDEVLHDNEMIKLYKNFELHEHTSYLDAKLSTELFDTHYFFRNTKEYGSRLLLVNPIEVGASYMESFNIIKIPAAIIQGRMYNADRPQYMNYGAIGFVLAHEITHGFDISDRDQNKSRDDFDWFKSETTKNKFEEKVSCLKNQYGNYTVKEVGMNINGSLTINENIADNGGIKLAYLAYKNWTSLNGPEPQLPGLEQYSPTQMLWISAAQTWCSVQRPEFIRYSIRTDIHSPPDFRVIGSVSNRKEFSDDFHCPLGSPMNPKNKCEFW